jgi:hypothetical protein
MLFKMVKETKPLFVFATCNEMFCSPLIFISKDNTTVTHPTFLLSLPYLSLYRATDLSHFDFCCILKDPPTKLTIPEILN